MAATGVATVREYAALIQSDGDETRRLAEDLTINVTSFFRDDEPFRTLEQIVILDVLERRNGREPDLGAGVLLRRGGVLLAMLLREQMTEQPRPPQLQIFATDIDAAVLVEGGEASIRAPPSSGR